MKNLKKTVAILLCLALVLGLFTMYAHAAEPPVTTCIDISMLQELYPEGTICTNTTPAFRLTVYGRGFIYSCEGCWGYAVIAAAKLFDLDLKASLPATWLEINKTLPSSYNKVPYTSARDSLQLGDILAAEYPAHAMVVIGMDENGVILAEGNVGGLVKYGRTLSYDVIDRNIAYVLRLAPSGTTVTVQTNKDENGASFEDVPTDRYYFRSVAWAVEHQVTAGTNKTHFSPDDPCTREQVLTFLWRVSGSSKLTDQKTSFLDVEEDAYYFRAVSWGLSHGITCGVRHDWFGVGEVCSRAQIVTLLWRLYGAPKPTTAKNPFADVEADMYYSSAVLWAVENGITAGKDRSHFCPDDACSRAEIVTFLYRAFSDHE